MPEDRFSGRKLADDEKCLQRCYPGLWLKREGRRQGFLRQLWGCCKGEREGNGVESEQENRRGRQEGKKK